MPHSPDTKDSIDQSSLERIVPDDITAGEATGTETLQLHIERYKFARSNLVPGSVLDMACGVGYGTSLLSENSHITNALGVDISDAAIAFAIRRYGNELTSYVFSNAMEFSPGRLFENVVSLETIEHVEDPHALFAHLVSLVAPGGRLIGSVPITPSVDANPHHKSNFSAKRFRRMADAHTLKYITALEQIQPFDPFAVAMRKEARTADLRHNISLFYLQNPAHFFLRLWSTVRHGFVNKYITIVWEKAG